MKMTNDIKKDVDSGVHGKWEKMYRKITNVIKVTDKQVVAALESSIISQCNVIRSENCANQWADSIVEDLD